MDLAFETSSSQGNPVFVVVMSEMKRNGSIEAANGMASDTFLF
jgi:hypothetical protein